MSRLYYIDLVLNLNQTCWPGKNSTWFLVIVCNFFYTLSDLFGNVFCCVSVFCCCCWCYFFFQDCCFYVHEKYLSMNFLFCDIFIWFQYYGNYSLIKELRSVSSTLIFRTNYGELVLSVLKSLVEFSFKNHLGVMLCFFYVINNWFILKNKYRHP